MRLLRYGLKGNEKSAILDDQDQLRDLSAVIADIDAQTLADNVLTKISQMDIDTLPIINRP